MGFLTETRSVSLLAGKPAIENLVMREIRSLPTRTVRRWSAWKPWAVLGGGALLALVGVPLILDAKSNFNTYDAMITSACSSGCPPSAIPQQASAAQSTGRLENVFAVSLFSVGRALIAGGVTMLVLNQPRVVPAGERAHASIAPLVGPGLFGLSFALQRADCAYGGAATRRFDGSPHLGRRLVTSGGILVHRAQ